MNLVMSTVLTLCFQVMFLSIVLLFRNFLVHKYSLRALNIVHSMALKLALDGRTDLADNLFSGFETKYGSYDRRLFSIHKWHFKSFFPDLEA